MTVLDWGIVAFAVAMGIWGYRQGLIVGALTLAGFLGGAFAGSRLGPLLLSEGSESPYAPLFAALGALLVGALVAVTLESIALGLRQRVIRGRALHALDGVGGAALIVAVALGLAWVFGAAALHTPGTAQLRGDVQRSLILRNLNDLLPPSGPVLNALSRVDPAPSIAGPTTPVAPPDAAIVSDPDVARREPLGGPRPRDRLRPRRRGVGLGRRARPRRHQRPRRRRPGRHHGDDRGRRLADARPRSTTTLATISRSSASTRRSRRSRSPPTRGAAPPARCSATPKTGPSRPPRSGSATPATCSARTPTAAGPSSAAIAFLRGSVRSGNSGGPIVDSARRVLATVFAATTSAPPGGFAIPDDVVQLALGDTSSPVDTGPCTS